MIAALARLLSKPLLVGRLMTPGTLLSWHRRLVGRPAASGSLAPTEHPVQAWVVQQARNLLVDLEDAGARVKFVLYDRDASHTAAPAVWGRAGLAWVSRRSAGDWFGRCREVALVRRR